MGITLAGFLWSLRNRIKIPGQLFAIYLFVNGMERFLIEKIRVNTTIHISSFSITQAEFISSLLMLFGIILFIRLNKKKSIE
jgi:prolipoprotein diacylglyceryltransferase